jgi:hypothetical protein
VIVVLITRLPTIDLAYQLRAGALVLAHGVPAADAFTFTAAGRPWMDLQWGAQVLLVSVFRAGGWQAIALAHAALVAGTYFFVWLASRATGLREPGTAIVVIASYLIAAPVLAMRPEAFALLVFAATFFLVTDRHRRPKALWFVPILTVAWTNLHGSFPLAVVMMTLVVIEDLSTRSTGRGRSVAVLGATMVATLVNPAGPGSWAYVVALAMNPTVRNATAEWAATSFATTAGATFLLSALVAAAVLARRGRTSWFTLAWLGVFFLLGLPALRGVLWWSVVAPVLVGAGFVERAREQPVARPARSDTRTVNAIFCTVLAAALVLALPFWRSGADPIGGGPRILEPVPQLAADAVNSALPAGSRVVIWQPWASWFELVAPEMPVFVDSRVEVFPDGTWDDYLALIQGRSGWEAQLDAHRVDAIILPTSERLLGPLLRSSDSWTQLHRDLLSVVYVRRSTDA